MAAPREAASRTAIAAVLMRCFPSSWRLALSWTWRATSYCCSDIAVICSCVSTWPDARMRAAVIWVIHSALSAASAWMARSHSGMRPA